MKHHNVISDALAVAEITMQAIKEIDVNSIEDLIEKLGFNFGLLSQTRYQPIQKKYKAVETLSNVDSIKGV